MRLSPLAVAVGLVIAPACSSKQDKAKPEGTPPPAPTAPAVVKKPLDTTPLPPLAEDPGGATGAPVYATGFGGLGIDAPRGIAVAPGGEAYVAGYFDGEIDFGGAIGKRTARGEDPKQQPSDGYLVKLGLDGAPVWAQTFGALRDDAAKGVAVRGETVVVVGNFTDDLVLGEFTKKSAGSDDAFVAAFDTAGGVRWAWSFGGIDSDGANAIAATPDGGWVLGGSFMRTANFGATSLVSRGGTDAMLIKLAPTGELEWIKQFGGAYADTILHVAVDAQGSIIVQGQFKDVADWGGPAKLTAGGGSDDDVVLAKYDLNGDHLWSQRFGNAFNDVAGGVTIDPAGNITMAGSFDKSIAFGPDDTHTALGESDIFVARFQPDGTLAWARTFGAEREDIASGVASDAAGNTVTTGWFQGRVAFGTTTLESKGNKDVFAVKLDAQGTPLWAHRFGDKDHDQSRAIALDAQGAALITGIYRFTLVAGKTSLSSVRAAGDRIPRPDTFVVKLAR